jgi:hypothetical protein
MGWFFDGLDRLLELMKEHGFVVLAALVLLLGVWLVIKYGPKILNAHIRFLTTATEAIQSQADCLTLLTAKSAGVDTKADAISRHMEHAADTGARVGHHVCDVIEHFGQKLEIADKIEAPVSAIRRELERVSPHED